MGLASSSLNDGFALVPCPHPLARRTPSTATTAGLLLLPLPLVTGICGLPSSPRHVPWHGTGTSPGTAQTVAEMLQLLHLLHQCTCRLLD